MKKYCFLFVFLIHVLNTKGQTNKFPDNGNVGIGTTSPDQKLTIKGGIGFDYISSDKKLYSPTDGVLEWMTHNAAGEHAFAVSHQGTKVIYLNTSGISYINGGNVGIGTTTPSNKLEVAGGVTTSGNSSINGVSFTLEDTYYKQIKAEGYNFLISSGAGDGHLLIPYNSTSPAHLFNLGLVVDKNVGIGTTTPTEKLSVNGKIRAREIKVDNNNWPDYVFAKNYELPSLQETEKYIKEKGHLPGFPSATEVKSDGIDLGEMNAKLLQKIEELTLYLIKLKRESEDQNDRLTQEIEILKSKIK